jgi:hypothetical protein
MEAVGAARSARELPHGKEKQLPKKVLPDGKVCIAYLHPGQVSAYFLESLLATTLYDSRTSRHITGLIQEWSSANVSAARNELVRRFLEKTAEWLLFIDSDMQFDHTAVERLLESADTQERPVVGGLCFGSSQGKLFPTIYQMTKVEERLTTMRMNDYDQDSMVDCAATGAAFLLINRGVLEAMQERNFNTAFPWFQETELFGKPSGEDITFCLRAGQIGAPIYVNTKVKIGHHKSHLLTEELFVDDKRKMEGDHV